MSNLPDCPYCGKELSLLDNAYFDFECPNCTKLFTNRLSDFEEPLTLETIWPQHEHSFQ